MSYACRHNDTTVIDNYDLDGMLNVLARRVDGYMPDALDARAYHAGAYSALLTLRRHDFRDQSEFFVFFDSLVGWRDGK